MRVCIFTKATPHHGGGGLQQHLQMVAEDCSSRGHEVEVVTTAHPTLGGVVIKWGDQIPVHFLTGTIPGRYSRLWWNVSVRTYEELHKERPFDLVVSEDGAAWGYVRAYAQGRVSTPIVMFRHGTTLLNIAAYATQPSLRNYANAALNLLHYLMWARPYGKFVDTQIAVAPHVAESARHESAMPPERVRLIMNGIDENTFSPAVKGDAVRESLGIGVDEPLLAWVGRLTKTKGWDVAYHVFAKVHESQPEVKMVMVGPGKQSEIERLEKMRRKDGLAGSLLYVGGVPYHEVPSYLASANVVVMPSTHPEGMPLVLLEALGAGKACVCPDTQAFRHVLRDGVGGILVKDLQDGGSAMASKVGLLLKDKALRDRLGREAREIALREFTKARMLDQVDSLFRQLVEDRNSNVLSHRRGRGAC